MPASFEEALFASEDEGSGDEAETPRGPNAKVHPSN
jgi:hypothetical protein